MQVRSRVVGVWGQISQGDLFHSTTGSPEAALLLLTTQHDPELLKNRIMASVHLTFEDLVVCENNAALCINMDTKWERC